MSPTTSDSTLPAAAGALRRKIVLDAGAEGVVRAGVEDDFHHFNVTIHHAGGRVTDVVSRHLRTPWLSCAGAGAMLRQLIGAPVSADHGAISGAIDAHSQCTHQYDLALMAVAQAARGGVRTYQIDVGDLPAGADGPQTRQACVRRDGVVVLDWTLDGSTVLAPAAAAGLNLRKLDMAALAAEDAEYAEAVLALRRAVMISGGRGRDLDQHDSLHAFAERMSGACFAFQPVRFDQGLRNRGTVRDFSANPELLLKEFK